MYSTLYVANSVFNLSIQSYRIIMSTFKNPILHGITATRIFLPLLDRMNVKFSHLYSSKNWHLKTICVCISYVWSLRNVYDRVFIVVPNYTSFYPSSLVL